MTKSMSSLKMLIIFKQKSFIAGSGKRSRISKENKIVDFNAIILLLKSIILIAAWRTKR